MMDAKKVGSLDELVEAYNELADSFNFLIKHISFKENFDGQIIENIKFKAGESKRIPHGLGIRPKHRIILNQVGNGVLSDVPFGWNQYHIEIKNHGAGEVTATLMLVKE